jgi:hypothetical protein
MVMGIHAPLDSAPAPGVAREWRTKIHVLRTQTATLAGVRSLLVRQVVQVSASPSGATVRAATMVMGIHAPLDSAPAPSVARSNRMVIIAPLMIIVHQESANPRVVKKLASCHFSGQAVIY